MANKKATKDTTAPVTTSETVTETSEMKKTVYTQIAYGVYSPTGALKNYKLVKFEYNPETDNVRVIGKCDLGNNVAGLAHQHTSAALAAVYDKNTKKSEQ